MSVNNVLQALMPYIVVLAPILLPPFVAWLVVQVKAAIAKLPANEQALLNDIIQQAVHAVEQVSGPFLTDTQKKAEALSRVEAALQHYGIKDVPSTVVDSAIESTVLMLNMAQDKMPNRKTDVPVATSQILQGLAPSETTKQGAK